MLIWGSRESERLLRRWIAIQLLFAAGTFLIWADLVWGRDSRKYASHSGAYSEQRDTADAANEFLRSGQVAHGAD